ncbi:MAG: zf-HC2 domain-containing protein, partial [Oscillospiraceae bacterium]|nr:zf-HC2 domain-containing protein [Oscillospiraceae bacterium]
MSEKTTTECGVIHDLLPLYADGVCGAESRALVEEHLKMCAECAGMLEQMRDAEAERSGAEKAEIGALRKIKRRLILKTLAVAAASVVGAVALTLALCV